MAKVSARGASLSSMGLADLAIYRGLIDEAREELTRGAAADEAGNQRAPRALKLVTLAEVELAAGARARALALADEALALSTAENVVVPAARILVATGHADRAGVLADNLEKQVQKRRRALAGVIRAEIALAQKKPVQAIDALSAARALADSWLVRFTLGRVYVEAGRFVEATAELEAAQKRVGEGAAMFMDDWPTFRETAAVPYWLATSAGGSRPRARRHPELSGVSGSARREQERRTGRRRAQAHGSEVKRCLGLTVLGLESAASCKPVKTQTLRKTQAPRLHDRSPYWLCGTMMTTCAVPVRFAASLAVTITV